ncbi:PfkB family carbohydrate kinase [Alkaliphilus serpentinus]|uniref:Fructoselysine 6-kinase n=1 Tax=Alkaliphilus serpentinus TaxID=1482731 RepID=A0A833HP21_9FIRM|nr:PfkB family carbohydrate kinase [Alkaliphilus serpentinus]KAB3529261.1 fructoselysine 6-kinase [Alkaliphilus serpentinus]
MKIAAVGDYMIDDYTNLNNRFLGGNALNFIISLQRKVDYNLSFVGPVATDTDGEKLLKALEEYNIETNHISIVKGRSPISTVELQDGERIFKGLQLGVLEDFRLNNHQISFLKGQDHIHSSIMGGLISQLKDMKGKGSTSFDFSILRNKKLIMDAVQWVDYAFFSSKTFGDNEISLMKEGYAAGGKQIVFLLGELGSRVYDGERIYECSAVKCKVLDTLGAGDSYIAGYISEILKGGSIAGAMEIGSRWAAEACGQYGGNGLKC